MQAIQQAPRRSEDALETRNSQRTRQFDKFEVLAAASEAESLSPMWIADRVLDGEWGRG